MLPVLIGFPFGTRVGGAELMLWSLLRNREAVGIAPHVLLFEDGPFRAELEAQGIPATVIEPGRFREPWRLAGAIAATARLIRETGPALCISWLPRVQTVLAPAAALTGNGKRVVYFEWELPRGLVNRAAVKLPCRWVVACSSAALAANQAMAPHRDGTTVWPGIDAPPTSSPARLAELRTSLGLGSRPVVGVVGRLLGWKGQDRLIEAAARLRRDGVDVDLLIVGGETHGVEAGIEERLRSLAATTGMRDRVFFTGHVEEPLPYVELMDVLVNASDGEPFGIVMLEAMALGIPVVAVAKGGPLDIVEHGSSGWLAPTGEPADLAAAVAALLSDERLRGRIASGGFERWRSHFREERMLADLRRTLHGLAAELDGRTAA